MQRNEETPGRDSVCMYAVQGVFRGEGGILILGGRGARARARARASIDWSSHAHMPQWNLSTRDKLWNGSFVPWREVVLFSEVTKLKLWEVEIWGITTCPLLSTIRGLIFTPSKKKIFFYAPLGIMMYCLHDLVFLLDNTITPL